MHCYQNLVVYEKGLAPVPEAVRTVGNVILHGTLGENPPTDWTPILRKLQDHTKSPWMLWLLIKFGLKK